ncbi:hypothetical protein GCM10023189_34650 [Nibrella saemangeumensis]|uniref:Uncharacterized protein n=1 Tax=Nibrella saemangeumensis TaxID=1084526 RepID=A0ABP8N288_9BACT
MNNLQTIQTRLQIGDVAAYWGAKCRYEKVNLLDSEWVERRVDTIVLDDIHLLGPERIQNFKLLLRKFSSLTYVECVKLFQLAFAKEPGNLEIVVNRNLGNISLRDLDKTGYVLAMWDHGKMFAFNGRPEKEGDNAISFNADAVLHYLQRIGVYMSCNIDRDLVELLDAEH